jgi:hypothetical protein
LRTSYVETISHGILQSLLVFYPGGVMSIELKAHQVMKRVGIASDDLVDSLSGQRFPLKEDSWGSITPFFPELAAAAVMPVIPPIGPPQEFHLNIQSAQSDGTLERATFSLSPEMRSHLLQTLEQEATGLRDHVAGGESAEDQVSQIVRTIPLRSYGSSHGETSYSKASGER